MGVAPPRACVDVATTTLRPHPADLPPPPPPLAGCAGLMFEKGGAVSHYRPLSAPSRIWNGGTDGHVRRPRSSRFSSPSLRGPAKRDQADPCSAHVSIDSLCFTTASPILGSVRRRRFAGRYAEDSFDGILLMLSAPLVSAPGSPLSPAKPHTTTAHHRDPPCGPADGPVSHPLSRPFAESGKCG